MKKGLKDLKAKLVAAKQASEQLRSDLKSERDSKAAPEVSYTKETGKTSRLRLNAYQALRTEQKATELYQGLKRDFDAQAANLKGKALAVDQYQVAADWAMPEKHRLNTKVSDLSRTSRISRRRGMRPKQRLQEPELKHTTRKLGYWKPRPFASFRPSGQEPPSELVGYTAPIRQGRAVQSQELRSMVDSLCL